MHITLSPQRSDLRYTLARQGDALLVDGEEFDFSPLQEGETLPASAIDCPWFAGAVERIDGVLRVSLLLPHGANPPAHVAFPDPIIDPRDGAIELPAVADAEPEPEPSTEEDGDD